MTDAAGRSWHLTGTIDPGDERVIRRNGQQMALNNGGDTVELLTAAGVTVDTQIYASSQDGVEITLN